jgi:hypothetical protein
MLVAQEEKLRIDGLVTNRRRISETGKVSSARYTVADLADLASRSSIDKWGKRN